jgi:lysophospholipase L1-like esterase
MEKRVCFLMLLLIVFVSVIAQNRQSWQHEFEAFEAQDAKAGIARGQILFIGSSTFTLWKDVAAYFPGHAIINRGFGGSKMQDVLRNFDRLVVKYAPKQVVVYEGDNDLASENYTVNEYMLDMGCFVRLLKVTLPDADLCIVSIKPSTSRNRETIDKYREANKRLKAFCKKNSVAFIDTWSRMWLATGTIDKSLFGPDMLHMNKSGYELWSRIIAPYLK